MFEWKGLTCAWDMCLSGILSGCSLRRQTHGWLDQHQVSLHLTGSRREHTGNIWKMQITHSCAHMHIRTCSYAWMGTFVRVVLPCSVGEMTGAHKWQKKHIIPKATHGKAIVCPHISWRNFRACWGRKERCLHVILMTACCLWVGWFAISELFPQKV